VPPWYLRWLLDGDILLPPWGDLVKEELKRRMAAWNRAPKTPCLVRGRTP